jgi:hypothetical protein
MKNALLGLVLAFSCCTQAPTKREKPSNPTKTGRQLLNEYYETHPAAHPRELNTLVSPLHSPLTAEEIRNPQ